MSVHAQWQTYAGIQLQIQACADGNCMWKFFVQFPTVDSRKSSQHSNQHVE